MGRFGRTDEVERPVGSCGMFGVCGRSSAALGREVVFNIHCHFGVYRLLHAWGSTGHALRFCSELPVEETLKGAGPNFRYFLVKHVLKN